MYLAPKRGLILFLLAGWIGYSSRCGCARFVFIYFVCDWRETQSHPAAPPTYYHTGKLSASISMFWFVLLNLIVGISHDTL